MAEWKKYRNYELSIWTLQDSYITTLKSGDPLLVSDGSLPAVTWPQARAQGQVQNGEMELNIDGTQTLSFDIPMYIYINGERVENPNWYTTIDKNIIISMRKIKVIFDKWQNLGNKVAMSNSTFEFLITKVQEKHEADNLICHIDCEGLAFHELGKVGYKCSLSTDEFNNEYYDWSIKTVRPATPEVNVTYDYSSESEKEVDKPIANVQYWMSKTGIEFVPKTNNNINYSALNPTKWYYDIRMAHTSLIHDINVASDKIYEEGFPVDWDSSGTPINYMEVREKARLMNIEESNLYNITQDIAEKFEIFCRYEYIYDNNYNIIGRLIIFYNNFLQEDKNVETLIYPNSASSISREMDSTDISTKMFVRSVDNDDLYTGQVNVMDCSANKSREDYLLNFDYLHEIGTISQEQYEEIEKYELKMQEYNKKITPLQEALNHLSNLKVDIDAKVTNLTKSIELDEERITENQALIYALDSADGDEDGFITRDYRNPEAFSLLKDSSDAIYDTYYIQLNTNDKCRGIQPDTLKLYKTYDTTSTIKEMYGIGFDPWKTSSITNDTVTIAIPSNHYGDGWYDFPFEYKGTIGSWPTVDALPSSPANKDAYKALTENYPSGYTIKKDEWFYYNTDKWEVKTSMPSDATNKGTIGKKLTSTDTLPTAENKPKQGWVYKVAQNGAGQSGTKIGDLLICSRVDNANVPTWAILSMPSEYLLQTNTQLTNNDLPYLYEKNNDTYTLTTDTEIDSSKSYYKQKYSSKNGFFIFTRARLMQINGPVSETCSCVRKGADGVTTDFIRRIRRLFYITGSTSSAPTIPTIATATTDETPVYNDSRIEEWTGFISSPDEVSASNIEPLSGYKYYTCYELKYNRGDTKFINFNDSGIAGDTLKDATDILIKTQITNAAAAHLKDEITGQFEKDEYGNLDKVTGLFQRTKQGSYFSYGVVSPSNVPLTSALNSYNKVVAKLNSLNVTEINFPGTDARKGKYVLIKETQNYSNSNIIYSYRYKYYNSNDVDENPENGTNVVNSITPIFYLKTKDFNVAVPAPAADKIKSGRVTNDWTTVLSDKTDETWKYYRGWAIIPFSGDAVYVYNASEDTSLVMRPTSVEDAEASNDAVPKYIYGTFKYKPDWYYEKIKDSWIQKKYQDTQDLAEYEDRQKKLETLIDDTTKEISNLIEDKKLTISKFEHMMGAALRESYWQPEDEYQNYGEKKEEDLTLFFHDVYASKQTATFFQNTTQNLFSSIGWDAVLYDEEDKLYYESSVLKTKVFYPCIDLSKISGFLSDYYNWAKSGSGTNPYSVVFNPTNKIIPASESDHDIRYCQYYTIGSRAKLAFLRDSHNIKPVLILLDASGLSDDELQNMYQTAVIGQLTQTTNADHNIILTLNQSYPIASANAWLNVTKKTVDGNIVYVENSSMKNYEMVYPRILIPSLKLKTNDKDFVLHVNNKELTKFEHYYILTQTYYQNTPKTDNTYEKANITYLKQRYKNVEKVNDTQIGRIYNFITYYTITIKPEYLFANINDLGNTTDVSIKIYYALSNADVDVYLDAKKILKENAFPKVSYEIEVSKWSPELLINLYNKLAQLVMINDTDLKFQNTFGYISSVKLDLDHEEKDTIEVKNYKTKFEDLFSRIVAETEEMHKNSRNIGLAGVLASGDSVTVTLSPDGLANTLSNPSNQQLLQAFLAEYFDGPEVVQQTLQDIWNEAGLILASAAQSLNNVMSATTQNANILAGFRENVTAAFTPNIYTGNTPPTTFKPGDLWLNEEEGYYSVATGYSGRGGFTRTYHGKLAEIEGSSFGMNADTGEIDIINQTNINLMSGKTIYIAANDNVDIVGNKAVNIGGTTINIASCNIIGEGYPGEVGGGGIHLVSTDYHYSSVSESLGEGASSYVNVHGEGIELASKKGIVIKSGEGIKIYSSNETNSTAIDENHGTAAVTINSTEGIWLGSNKSLKLYSGDVILDDDGNVISGNVGSNVELTPGHLLLGVGNLTSNNATAIEMSDEQIIIAAGSKLDDIKTNDKGEIADFGSSELAGVQIKKDYIGMATGSGTERSLLSLTPQKVMVGLVDNNDDYITMPVGTSWSTSEKDTDKIYLIPNKNDEYYEKHWYENGAWKVKTNVGPESFSGSYVWLSKSELYIGTLGNFTLNTNNIKIQSKNLSDALGTGEKNVEGMGFALGMNLQGLNNTTPEVGLGFWIEKTTSGNTTTYTKHLVVDANEIRLGSADIRTMITDDIYVEYIRTDNTVSKATIESDINKELNGQSHTYNWSADIPTATYTTGNGYKTADNIECIIGTEITKNVTLSADDAENTIHIVTLSSDNETVTVTVGGEQFTCKNGDIWYKNTDGYELRDDIIPYETKVISDPYIWERKMKVTSENSKHFEKLRRAEELEKIDSASDIATGLASGILHVPTVQSSGLIINGNKVMLTSTGKLMLLGNSEIFIGTSSSNSALILNKQGISIGTQGNIGIVSSGNKGIDIKVIKNNTEYNGIIMNKNTGFKVYSNVAINMDAPNFKVVSSPTAGNPYFYVGDSGNSPDTYIKYVSSITANNVTTPAHLEVKGAITATAFVLDPNCNKISAEMIADGVIPDANDFGINGIGWQNWNNKNYVSLTARANGDDTDDGDLCAGILIGYSDNTQHLIVPYDKTHSNTVVDISRDGIKFNHYKVSDDILTNDTYIHMDSEGIDMKGSHIYINGEQEWSRDDIIIMNPNAIGDEAWRSTVDGIVNHMEARSDDRKNGDWVLIRPFYNAEVDFEYKDVPVEMGYTGTISNVPLTATTAATEFADNANWYKYTVSIDMVVTGRRETEHGNGKEMTNQPFICKLKVYNGSGEDVTTLTFDNGKYTEAYVTIGASSINLYGWHGEATISYNGTEASGKNYCKDGYTIELAELHNVNGHVSTRLNNFKLICETDATSSTVPCTVYYYPKKST